MNEPRLIDLPKVASPVGNLTAIESADIPFDIQRVYYLYDVPGGAARGAHAHRALEQFIVAVGGSFDVILDDGATRRTFPLALPYRGLYVPPMYWRDLVNFSSGSVCLVLASGPYDESDYIRDYDSFVAR